MKINGFLAMLAATLALTIHSPPLRAVNCKVTGGALDCRELENAQLGKHYCFVPDAMPIRQVVPVTGQPDLWVTLQDANNKHNDIDLDNFGLAGGIAQGTCTPVTNLFLKHTLRVTKSGNDYLMTLTPPADHNPMHTVQVTMTEGGPGTDKLWLSGQHPANKSFRYYLFLRDESPTDTSKKFPKFLMVAAFDFSDGTCFLNAPEVPGNITEVANSQECKDIATAQPPASARGPAQAAPDAESGVVETGVGGGGEKK
jgi:hypothetical protein